MNEAAVDLEVVKQAQQKIWSEGDFSMVAGTVSRFRPPWFETMTPAAPCFSASLASWGSRMPFRRSGTFVCHRSQWTSSHVIGTRVALTSPSRFRPSASRCGVSSSEGRGS